MATLYKEHTIEAGAFLEVSFPSYFVQGANPSPPTWFDWIIASPYGFDMLIGYSFTGETIGTFDIYFTELLAPPETYYIRINVVVSNYTSYDNCCDNQCNIAWLNREGGWQNYIFTGVKEFNVSIGDTNTFVNNNLEQKYSEIKGVYNGRICSTGDIPKSHVDILESLQYAIQSFLYNTETELFDIPILIDKKDFVKYRTRDKFFDVKIRFILAEQVLIQTQ